MLGNLRNVTVTEDGRMPEASTQRTRIVCTPPGRRLIKCS